MAAASERRELSAAASRHPSAYPAAVHKESRHITARRPARPLRRRAGIPGSSGDRGEAGGKREADWTVPGEGRAGQGAALLSMPSVAALGSLGPVPSSQPATALAAAAFAATRGKDNELSLGLCPETQPEAG
ncbi:hypothetical protein H8959_011870 [Pygathrix nigripes]